MNILPLIKHVHTLSCFHCKIIGLQIFLSFISKIFCLRWTVGRHFFHYIWRQYFEHFAFIDGLPSVPLLSKLCICIVISSYMNIIEFLINYDRLTCDVTTACHAKSSCRRVYRQSSIDGCKYMIWLVIRISCGCLLIWGSPPSLLAALVSIKENIKWSSMSWSFSVLYRLVKQNDQVAGLNRLAFYMFFKFGIFLECSAQGWLSEYVDC